MLFKALTVLFKATKMLLLMQVSATTSVATTFGLGFIPLHQSRYDLVILKEYLDEAPVQQLLSTLGHRLVHSQFEVLGGYDTSKIGEVVATIWDCLTTTDNA
jgi:molybdate-binding protein